MNSTSLCFGPQLFGFNRWNYCPGDKKPVSLTLARYLRKTRGFSGANHVSEVISNDIFVGNTQRFHIFDASLRSTWTMH